MELQESDDNNLLETHFKHSIFEVPHEQVWTGEEVSKSHRSELNTLRVEFLATFNLFFPMLWVSSVFAHEMKEQGKGRDIDEKCQC